MLRLGSGSLRVSTLWPSEWIILLFGTWRLHFSSTFLRLYGIVLAMGGGWFRDRLSYLHRTGGYRTWRGSSIGRTFSTSKGGRLVDVEAGWGSSHTHHWRSSGDLQPASESPLGPTVRWNSWLADTLAVAAVLLPQPWAVPMGDTLSSPPVPSAVSWLAFNAGSSVCDAWWNSVARLAHPTGTVTGAFPARRWSWPECRHSGFFFFPLLPHPAQPCSWAPVCGCWSPQPASPICAAPGLLRAAFVALSLSVCGAVQSARPFRYPLSSQDPLLFFSVQTFRDF